MRIGAYGYCQLAGWSLYVAASIAVLGSAYGGVSGKFLAYSSLAGCSGLLATHVLRREIKRRRWLELPPVKLMPRALAAGFGASFAAWSIIFALTLYPFRYNTVDQLKPSVLIGTLINWAIITYFWMMVYVSVYYFRNFRRADLQRLQLEALASEAQLRALRSQINPHFLFNSLNSLRALIVEEPHKAQRMVTQLSNILRYSLGADRSMTVPLSEELETVRDYLDLEAIRFEDRLRVQWKIEPDTLSTPTPPMLVQTLVENAIKHGISRLPKGGDVLIETTICDGLVRIVVSSTGSLIEGGPQGVGLRNTRERLRLLHGECASLVLRNNEPDRVTAEVIMPFLPTRKEAYASADRR
jgi:signal transduction histidine kinase